MSSTADRCTDGVETATTSRAGALLRGLTTAAAIADGSVAAAFNAAAASEVAQSGSTSRSGSQTVVPRTSASAAGSASSPATSSRWPSR